MSRLTDITIYFDEKSPWTEFRLELNYICDKYHNRLDGYKPPKTSRICLNLRDKKVIKEPVFIGAICQYDIEFDFEQFNTVTEKLARYRLILGHLHKTILEIGDFLSWDQTIFTKSYQSIIDDDFEFIKVYPARTSQDKMKIGQVVIEKTETKTVLKVRIENGQTFETDLIDKKNWFWFDTGYQLADQIKWIDQNSFGYRSVTEDKVVYYSVSERKVIRNFEFRDEDL